MQILLVHQNFPGQFRELAPAWLARGHTVSAIGCMPPEALQAAAWRGLIYHPYHCPPQRWRGQVVGDHLRSLQHEHALRPDLVIAHAGWGEASAVKTVWPKVPLIVYPELWGSPRALGVGFDSHRPPLSPAEHQAIARQNRITAHAMTRADALVVPTVLQRDGFPEPWAERIVCIHEGVPIDRLRPNPSASLRLPDGHLVDRSERVITYVSRRFEPLRGIHTFLAALPPLLERDPGLQVLLVGGEGPGYGLETAKPLQDLPTGLDASRVHHLGHLDHRQLTTVLQVSSVHVYLSYPYTLSWSVLEAMACGVPVVTNHDGPLEGVIHHEANGLLVDFNAPEQLRVALQRLLDQPALRRRLGEASRHTVEAQFSLSRALAHYDQLFHQLCSAAAQATGQSATDPAGPEPA